MLALHPATLGGVHDLLARALVFVVLTAGVLAALAALLLRRGPVNATPASDTTVSAFSFSAFSGVIAALLALGLGGPGALPWLVLACLVGAAIQEVEARFGEPDDRASDTGTLGHVLKVSHALAATFAVLTAGALLHAHQAGELADGLGGLFGPGPATPIWVGLGLAALTLAGLRGPGRWLAPLSLVAVATHVALMLLLLAGGGLASALPDMFDAALGGQAALAGAIAAAAQGVLRASVAGATGGLAMAAPGRRFAWAGPVVTAAAALLTGLAALAGNLQNPPLAASRQLFELEQHLRGGLSPSEYGQLITLPDDAGLEEGQRYALVLRADPRGHKYGKVFPDENMVAAPAWEFTRTVDTIILRDKDPERGKNPAFDVRIPARREVVETGAGPFVKLYPRDPHINIRRLMAARDLEGPFLNVADYSFEAGVVRGMRLGGDEHLSLIAEPVPADAPKNPSLREFITFNYTGPFRPGERPPMALAAPLDGGLELGGVAHLRLDPPPRGLELGFVNRLGELEVPAWDFLAAADSAVLRHATDPSLDVTIPVQSRIAYGRLRFTSPGLELDKLADLYPEHSGPHLQPAPYEFAVEVHRGARLPAGIADTSLALIPVHPQVAPAGNPGPGTYHPHPGEVLLTDMRGPYVDSYAAGALVGALRRGFGPAIAGLGAAALILLAVAGLVQWLRAGQRSARPLLGASADLGFALVFLACVALGPALGLPPLLRVADAAAALAVLLGVGRLLARLPRSRPVA